MTLQQLLVQETQQLNNAGVPNGELDARYLLLEAFHMSLASFLAGRGQEIASIPDGEGKAARFREMTERRARRIPLQQVLGVQEFMGLEFYVNEHVLTPRQDTETLVELVLAEQREKAERQEQEKAPGLRLLDLCTGSGCIALSLVVMGKYSYVSALDLSAEALRVARRNADRLLAAYEGQFNLFESDMFSAVPEGELYDVLVSNPPYIPSAVIESLEPEVRDHEPRMALDGTEDGLKFYRILAEEGKMHLEHGGAIYLEIGWDQSEAVSQLLEENGFTDIRTVKDMAGLDRVVRAGWP